MAQRSNTFEGGSNGIALTPGSGGNTGGTSGDFFDAIDVATGATVIFSSAAAYIGSLGMRTQVGATAGNAAARWGTSLVSTIDEYGRAFVKVGVTPPNTGRIITFYDSSGVNEFGSIRLTTTGKIAVYGVVAGVQTLMATSVTSYPIGSYMRVEFRAHADTATAFINVRLYLTPGSSSADEDFGGGNTFAGRADIGRVEFGPLGVSANWPSSSQFIDFDAVVAGASTWVGPASSVKVITSASVNATSNVSGSNVATRHVFGGAVSATSTAGGSVFRPGQPTTPSTYGVGTYGQAVYGGSGAPPPLGIRGNVNATSTVGGGLSRLSAPGAGGGVYTPPYTPPTPPPPTTAPTVGNFALAVYDLLNIEELNS